MASSNRTSKPCFCLISAGALGSCSIVDSSKIDCALSVTGPYESTAIVTGPMPRKPNATSPKANTAGATMIETRPAVLTRYATDINAVIVMPSQ